MRCPICGSKECCGGDMAMDNTFLRAEIDRLNTELTRLRAAQPAVPDGFALVHSGLIEAIAELKDVYGRPSAARTRAQAWRAVDRFVKSAK